jgi:hypothetical protein
MEQGLSCGEKVRNRLNVRIAKCANHQGSSAFSHFLADSGSVTSRSRCRKVRQINNIKFVPGIFCEAKLIEL